MATKTSHLVRPLVALVALVAAMAALLIAYSASPAHAAGTCTTTAGTTTCTFSPTGSEDTFVVPDGVSSVHVVATGAPGAVGNNGGSAGRGATVIGDLTVTPGDTLYVNVGGAPTVGGTSACYSDFDCIGGFNGGGGGSDAFFAGGGGGASDVRTVSRDQDGSLVSRLIVAGGGGGSGQGAACVFPPQPMGGAGGDAGSFGGDGLGCDTDGSTGGGAGTQSDGGVGGEPFGTSGALGQGGDGGPGGDDSGGGGGGYYGGGGGGSSVPSDDDLTLSAAGGGGGGSNLVPEGGTATLDDSGVPSIAISYKAGVGEEPPTSPENKQACKKGGWKEFGFKNQGQCIKAVNHPS